MKRTIALICAAALIALSFTSCKKTEIIDEHGDSHTLVMKKGEPVQDEYGNMIEEYTNADGESVTGSITFPVVTKESKSVIRNAFISMKIPKDWTFNESVKAFRLQHKDCNHDGVCQIDVETQPNKTLDEEYRRKLAAQEVMNLVGGDDSLVSNINEFKTKLFGLDTKAFKCAHQGDMTYYYYVFFYANNTIGFSFIMNDDCFDESFDPEAFIKENVSLKTIPTAE